MKRLYTRPPQHQGRAATSKTQSAATSSKRKFMAGYVSNRARSAILRWSGVPSSAAPLGTPGPPLV